ncbi:hypothetical protein IW261DRAFT_1339935, partial [Armillaria novae-zelandiae]
TKAMKLGGCVWEGYWIGLDKTSNGSCIYWPESRKVSVKQNVYFDKTHTIDNLKGEEDLELYKIPLMSKA